MSPKSSVRDQSSSSFSSGGISRRSFLAASTATLAGGALGLGATAESPTSTLSFTADDGREIPFRGVNLDFHTSELITDVAADFNATEFLNTLQRAKVNTVNIFAKCHHGWAYYDTKVAHKHPHLKIDLLGEQIAALRPAGIAVNVYYSLVWDNRSANATPEWRALDKKGQGIYHDYWPWMCLNTPYMDQVIAENTEILDRFQVDGMFWDILIQPPSGCFCKWCVADRHKQGLTDSPEDIYRQNKSVALRTEKLLVDLLKSKQPKAICFFNSRLVIGISDELPYFSDLAIESLPTGGWGYTHFEHRVRYCRTLHKQMIGMTGRFHKSWGDFGGFKPQAALDFETMNFLANGARTNIGDQLHPRGVLDPYTYGLIGNAFTRVERQEGLVRGMRCVADIGVISSMATAPSMAVQGLPPSDEGFTNMLVELHQQFDVLDLRSDLHPYKLIILPDNVLPVPELVEKLRTYIASGGALIATHRSLITPEETAFALSEFGVHPLGPTRFKGEYLLPEATSFPGIAADTYFLYQQGLSITAEPNTKVLAVYGHPYFDRSPEHWSSHAQTPFSHATDEPVITRLGNVIYCANPLFTSYALDGALIQKLLVSDMINALLPRPSIRSSGVPSTARLTLLQHPVNGDQTVQILYAPYERRAPQTDIIEEPATFVRAAISVARARAPRNVTALDGEGRVADMKFTFTDGYVEIPLLRVTGQLALSLS